MQKKFVLWLTGLSAAGKTTLAEAIYQKLSSEGIKVHHLDGDEVRQATSEKFGFDRDGRDKNIKLAIDIAKNYQREGYHVVASFIAPYRHHRTWGRDELDHYIEVFVDTPLETCEKRDPKGLYKKARSGEIKSFTGIDDPYEEPEHPDIHIKTCEVSVEEAIDLVIAYLRENGYIVESQKS